MRCTCAPLVIRTYHVAAIDRDSLCEGEDAVELV